MRRAIMQVMMAVLIVAGCQSLMAQEQSQPSREAIGKVLGRTVYRDEIEIPKEYRDVDPDLYKKLRSESLNRTDLKASDSADLLALLEDDAYEGSSDIEFDIEPEDESDFGDLSDQEDADAADEEEAGGKAGEDFGDEVSEVEIDESDMVDEGGEEISDGLDYGTPEEMSWEREKIVQNEMMRLFAGPLFAEFAAGVAKEIEPKPEEIEDFWKVLSKGGGESVKITPDLKLMGSQMIESWKLNIKLYEQFGGGRVLWQQAGFEAFDAMKKFLEEQKKQGRFEIYDPKLQESMDNYWTEPGHSGFLKDDPDTIKEFLHPEWKR